MKRRTFLQSIIGGVTALFLPKAEATECSCDRCQQVKTLADRQNTTETKGWLMSYTTRILNDSNVTVISGGTPEEMESIYKKLEKEFPELCN